MIPHQSSGESQPRVNQANDRHDLHWKAPHVVEVPHELPGDDDGGHGGEDYDFFRAFHLILSVSSAARLSTPPRSMLFIWASSGFTYPVSLSIKNVPSQLSPLCLWTPWTPPCHLGSCCLFLSAGFKNILPSSSSTFSFCIQYLGQDNQQEDSDYR